MKVGEALGTLFPNLEPIINQILIPIFDKLKVVGTAIKEVFVSMVGSIKTAFAGIGTAFTSGGILAGLKAILV
jgi:hypothetical protein